ncbi:MAG: MCP four helix bundle domain-containing protein, partial [Angelakisella sp.]
MLKNMKIATKLIAAFIVVVLVASIAGVVGLVLMKSVDTSYSNALINNGFVLGDIGDYNAYLNKGGAIVRDIIMLTDPAEIKAAQAEMEEIKAKTQASLDAAKVACTTPEELALIDRIEAAAPGYKAGRDKAVALGLTNKNDEALQVFRKEALPYLNECMAAGQELMALNKKLGIAVSDDLTSQSNFGIIIMILLIAASTVISIFFAWVVARSISKPVKACAARLKQLSEGDLHTPVMSSDAKDETGVMLNALKDTTDFLNTIIGDIRAAFAEMARGNLDVSSEIDYIGDFDELKSSITTIIVSLNETLGQINIASDQVSSGSDQVSSGAQALSQGATEQASSVEELAATITEISHQVKENAANANLASQKMVTTEEEITTSNEKMQKLIVAMGDIGQSSQEIGKVIKTIEDIAFQTNILALNA